MKIREKFINQGYLIIEDLIDENLLSFLKNNLTEIINNEDISDYSEIYFDKDNQDSKKVFMIGDLLAVSDKFLRLVFYEPILNLIKEIFKDNEFEFQFLQAIIKHPNIGRKVNWHRDFNNKVLKYLNSDTIRTIICLDEMNNNGEIQILEQSHQISDDEVLLSKVKAKEIVDDNQEKIKSLVCKEGSIIILSSKLIHCSLENKSDKIRQNLIMEWCSSDNALVSGMRWSYQGFKPLSSNNIKNKQNQLIKNSL